MRLNIFSFPYFKNDTKFDIHAPNLHVLAIPGLANAVSLGAGWHFSRFAGVLLIYNEAVVQTESK